MNCPNGDVNFNNLLSKMLGKEVSAEERIKIYYFVCVYIRVAVAFFVLFFKDSRWLHYILLFFSMVAIYNLYTNTNQEKQWWSKKFQLCVAVVLFIFSFLSVSKLLTFNTLVFPILLFISVFGGVFQSLFVKIC